MTTDNHNKNQKLSPLIGIAVLAAAAGVILFTGGANISRDKVEAHLKQIADNIAADAASDGQEAKFTYGPIAMQGWGYDKRAIVSDVSLDLAERSALFTSHLLLSTPRMQVLPAPAFPGELSLSFADPVNIIENGQIKSVMTFSSPLKYGYFNGKERGQRLIMHTMHLPEQITIAPAKSAEQPAGPADSMVINYDKNPAWLIKAMPDKGQREETYQFRNIRISDGPTQITAASLDSSLKQKPGADSKAAGNYTLTLVDVSLRDHDKSSKSYTLNVNLNYTGDLPALKLAQPAAAANSDITLNQALLASDDFKIRASGSVKLAADDPLPSGAVNVDIDNTQAFLKSELLPDAWRKPLTQALQNVTGQPAASLTNVEIPLKRDKNGTLYVGSMTFETLAASMLGNMIVPPASAATAPQAATPTPAAPDSSASPAAPKPEEGSAASPAQPKAQESAPAAQPQPAAPRPDDAADKAKNGK